jgi:molybdopterin converting factor subunit 1
MRVKIRLFARLRESAGTSECDLDVPDDATVHDVWSALVRRYPSLAPFGDSTTAAVNADFAKRMTRVAADDEVAFLPPVSGGQGQESGRR